MQQALPYMNWAHSKADPNPIGRSSTMMISVSDEDSMRGKSSKDVKSMVSENAVLLIGKRGCCMCHVMKRLLLGLGVNPSVCEVDEDEESRVVNELGTIGVSDSTAGKSSVLKPQFPSVYIGGKLFGGLDQLMAAHISGELTPILKKAGALWL
ncbi:hypothetical protein Sjap_000355 [Stephania japonica]|uniref:Glutaredoxin domain-containing protein n=1 Tax=Stephania japonica TaxID=461633 RepID=A0AAP0PSD3_9MAGN